MARPSDEQLGRIQSILGDEATHFGEPVVNLAITIPSLAGGLRDALDVEPFLISEGERGYLIVEVLPTGEHGYTPFVDKNANETKAERHSGPWTFEQKLKAGTIVKVDEDLVIEAVTAMTDKVRALRDAEAGQAQIPGVADGSVVPIRPADMSDEEWDESLKETEEALAAAEAAAAAPLVDDEEEFLADAARKPGDDLE